MSTTATGTYMTTAEALDRMQGGGEVYAVHPDTGYVYTAPTDADGVKNWERQFPGRARFTSAPPKAPADSTANNGGNGGNGKRAVQGQRSAKAQRSAPAPPAAKAQVEAAYDFRPPAPVPVEPFPFAWGNLMHPDYDERDLIQGVLGQGDVAAVVGASGAAKSFLVLHAAVCIALGNPFFGRQVEQGVAVLIVYEGRRRFERRMEAALKHVGHTGPLPLAVLHAEAPDMQRSPDLERLLATVRAIQDEAKGPVRLIAVDTLAQATPGLRENEAEDVGRLMRHAAGFAAETGAAFLWVHHLGKDSTRGARGSSAFYAALDTELTVTQDADGVRTVRATKNRDGAGDAVGYFRLIPVEVGSRADDTSVGSVAVEPCGPPVPKAKKPPKGAARMLALLERLQAEVPATPEGTAGMVPRDEWREAARAEIYGDKSIAGARQAFGRGVTWLFDRGDIVQSQGAYGIPPERDT